MDEKLESSQYTEGVSSGHLSTDSDNESKHRENDGAYKSKVRTADLG
jgi:hypothetical protein